LTRPRRDWFATGPISRQVTTFDRTRRGCDGSTTASAHGHRRVAREPETADDGPLRSEGGPPTVKLEPLRAERECQTLGFHRRSSKFSTSDTQLRPSDSGASPSTGQRRVFEGQARASEVRCIGCFWAVFGPLRAMRQCLTVACRSRTVEIECLRSIHAPKTAALGRLQDNGEG